MRDHQAVTKLIQDSPYNCAHPSIELRIRQHSNSTMHYVDQCLTCGAQLKSHRRNSTIVAQAKLNGGTREFDETLSDAFSELARKVYTDRRDTGKAEWDAWYAKYLQSPKWKSKRAEVMRRDKFTCQGCHGRATLVHHDSYKNVGDELLFQLIALCDDCHERVHKNERG